VKQRIGFLLLVGLWGTPAAAQRSYTIDRFDAVIQVQRDASIQVTETITARFVGSWNGIYRTIPVTYRTPQGFNWTLGLTLQRATDGEGRPLRVEANRERHYIKFKMWIPGAADATRTVVLKYRATNGLRFFEDHDELYWNVTGDEWDVPLGAATARIELPPGADGVRAIAFNGAYGSTAQEARVETRGTTVTVAMPHALGFHEGLTAVVGWNKGLVTEPPVTARAQQAVTSNWPLVIPIPVFFLAFFIWRRRGKDPRRLPIAVQYEPPRGLSPAEAGTLLDNSADLRDITATMVDLAVRGYLRIEEREGSKFFGLVFGRDYTLRRLDPPAGAAELAPHERRLFDGIFAGRSGLVELSDLKEEFYTEITGIKTSVFDRLLGRGFYHARPDQVRIRWIVAAVVFGGVIAIGGGAMSAGFLMTPVPFIAAGVLVGAILLGFSLIMPARTEAGTRALEHVLGFEDFLRRVESENLKRIIVGHPELFDRYLPFAMAFGVERKWARAFEGIYTQPPTWFVGPSMTHFNVSGFSANLAHLSTTAGSTLTSSPRSSGGSGFGGGGSSGGGGGGGGGGAF
jgi:uncharacterized membrane protein YgcG